MAVRTFCENIVNAYTHCEQLAAIYTYGELVWPTGPHPAGVWYVDWTPTNLSGSFNMYGPDRMENYSGHYTWSVLYSGSKAVITPEAWKSTSMVYMETNGRYILDSAFQSCSSMTVASMSRCREIYTRAFFADRSLREVYLPVCQFIGTQAFDTCDLSFVDLPRCSWISDFGFANNHNMSYASLPACQFIDSYGFAYNSNLQYISLPVCSRTGVEVFEGCYSLSWAYLPVMEQLNAGMFENCYMLSSVYAPVASSTVGREFLHCSALVSIELPECKVIGERTFGYCENLSDVSLPKCEIVYTSAFVGCNSLSSIDLPVCKDLFGACFLSLSNLKSVSAPVCERISGSTFKDCTGLQYLYFPACESVGYDAFNGCTSLISISLPECSYIGSTAFQSCYKLENISLPKCEFVSNFAFQDCSLIYNVNLGECSFIGSGAFENCPSLRSLRLSSWCSILTPRLGSDETFQGTPFSRCVGSILVPPYMVNRYKNDSGWSSLSCIIYADPDFPPGSYYFSFTTINRWGTVWVYGESVQFTNFLPSGESSMYYSYFYTGKIGPGPYSSDTNAEFIFSGCSFNYFETNATEILDGGFDCDAYDVSLPHCSYIGGRFHSGLSKIYAPECAGMGNNVFYSCYSLTSIDLPECVSMGDYVFYSCSRLSSVYLPKCKTFGSYVFAGCSRLSTIDLLSCESLDYYAFRSCTSLVSISLPECSYIGMGVFGSCSRLSSLDLPVCSSIGFEAFSRCGVPFELTLRWESVCSGLGGAFNNWSWSNVFIYVPSSLYSSYRQAYRTDRVISSRFFSIPEPEPEP